MRNLIGILKNPEDKKRVKGSVLYTVIGVMLVMTIFVMSALAMAANANKRAYESYTRTQTQYTARSVVESIITTMTTEGNSLGPYASGLSAGATMDLQIENNVLPDGLGTVDKVTLECVGKDEIGSANYVDGTGQNVIKITATVTLAGKTSTYTEYALNAKITTKKMFPSGGLISYGGVGTTNNPRIYGDAFAIDNQSTDPFSAINNLSNETILDGSSYFNSNVVLNSGKKIILGSEQGFTIRGNLGFQNNPEIKSTADTDDYVKVPFISVGGLMNCNNNMVIGTASNPINIYCGTIIAESNQKEFNSDIYAYDQLSATETYTIEGVTANKGDNILGSTSSKLLNWANNLITNKNGVAGTYTGGNFFTNGNLTMKDGYNAGGDVVIKGNAGIHMNSNEITIDGALYVKGDLSIQFNGEGRKLTVTNGIYCDGTITIYNNGFNNSEIRGAIIADHITTSGGGNIKITKGIFTSNPETAGTFAHMNIIDTNIKINNVVFNADEQVYLNQINAGAESLGTETKYKIANANYEITFPAIVAGQSYASQINDIKANMDSFFPNNMQRMTIPDPASPTYAEDTLLYEDNLYKDIVPTPETIANSHNQADGYLDKPEDAASWNTTYTMDTLPEEITTSCTILTRDDGINRTIKVKPDGTADIWINLVGEYNSSMGMTTVTVDNSNNRETSEKTIRNVNFFVSQNQEITYADPAGGASITRITEPTFTFNKVSFLVDKYKQSGDLVIAQSPADMTYPDLSVIPNIYIYAGVSDATESAGTGDEAITFTGSCSVTGYIIANYSKFSWGNIGGGINANLIYQNKDNNASEVVGTQAAIVGKVIMGNGSATGNDMTICEIDPSGGIGGGPPPSEQNSWEKFSGGFARQ